MLAKVPTTKVPYFPKIQTLINYKKLWAKRLGGDMRYIIVDLEATCWEGDFPRDNMEIIEIGAVELLSAKGPISRQFCEFVRPVHKPVLSDYCTKLTSITQNDVTLASTFPSVFQRFVDWVGADPFIFGSWGAFDLKQLKRDCVRHNMIFPLAFEQHSNIKRVYAKFRHIPPCPMTQALQFEGLPLEGVHHRGIDDARNIAKLVMAVLGKPIMSGRSTVPSLVKLPV